MARNVFISFRFSDGNQYKEELVELFKKSDAVIDYSEDEDRSSMSEETIRKYLYRKLKSSSVTVILLTPNAIEHRRNWLGVIDDWMYDEIRYSLEDRENNRCNGLVAVYTKEAKDYLISSQIHKCDKCKKETTVKVLKDVNNLFSKNMCNVKPLYKKNECEGIYDSNLDSYCSLVSYEDFKENFEYYIELAFNKREVAYKYDLKKKIIN